jgi:creatinine amidohydrolase
MTPVPHQLARATFADLQPLQYDLAVLPWGATEPHNLHLPYATDNVEAEWFALEAARRANAGGARCIVLPTLPFGVNTMQLTLPLTINMNPSTQALVLADVAASLERQGIPRLVILNGHGGNDFKPMVRELTARQPVFLCVVDWFRVAPRADFFRTPGDHADELETAVMLAIAPEQVRPLATAGPGAERKLRLTGFREGWAWTPRDWPKATDDTGVGDPRGATVETGQRYCELAVARIAEFLTALAGTPIDALYEGLPPSPPARATTPP